MRLRVFVVQNRAEARAQAQKELELRQKLMATVQKDKKFTDEAWAILDQLNNMKETEGKTSEPVEQAASS